MFASDLEIKFKGIWQRALNEPPLEALTPELIVKWATDKGLADATATLRGVGAFHPTLSIVLETGGVKACLPMVPASGDGQWNIRRQKRDEEALLWEKMEWFLPLWLPMGKIGELLTSVKHCNKERAIQLFDYHMSTLYTLAFQAVCIAQLMPKPEA